MKKFFLAHLEDTRSLCGQAYRLKLTIMAVCLLLAGPAWPAPIDLNNFYKDPTVTVAADGASAVLEEDSGLASVLLANDPGLGDPVIIVPAAGSFLAFEYNFVERAGNDDEFGALIVDAATHGSAGTAYEFFTQNSGSGTVVFDLSGLVGASIGLQFQLAALPGDITLDSSVTVSNVRVEQNAISEPEIVLLFLTGLIGLWLRQRGIEFGTSLPN